MIGSADSRTTRIGLMARPTHAGVCEESATCSIRGSSRVPRARVCRGPLRFLHGESVSRHSRAGARPDDGESVSRHSRAGARPDDGEPVSGHARAGARPDDGEPVSGHARAGARPDDGESVSGHARVGRDRVTASRSHGIHGSGARSGGKRRPLHHRRRIPITLPLSDGAGNAAWARAIAANTSRRSGAKGAERPVAVSTCMHMISFVAAR